MCSCKTYNGHIYVSSYIIDNHSHLLRFEPAAEELSYRCSKHTESLMCCHFTSRVFFFFFLTITEDSKKSQRCLFCKQQTRTSKIWLYVLQRNSLFMPLDLTAADKPLQHTSLISNPTLTLTQGHRACQAERNVDDGQGWGWISGNTENIDSCLSHRLVTHVCLLVVFQLWSVYNWWASLLQSKQADRQDRTILKDL